MIINKFALDGRDDYIGFTYNGQHSSEFRVIRVNSGSRYETTLIPTPKDTTIDVPGRDGLYYVTSKYQQRTIPVSIAFDDLYDEDIANIKKWLAPQTEGELWFDEDPYKQYTAKITSSPKLSWIAFDDPEKGRVYKGEGTIQFVCYYPWASSRFRNLKEVYQDIYGTEDPSQLSPSIALPRGWEIASGLQEKENIEKTFDYATQTASQVYVYNAGNIATPWQMAFSIQQSSSTQENTGQDIIENQDTQQNSTNTTTSSIQKIEYFRKTENGEVSVGRLYIDVNQLTGNKCFLIDTNLHLLLEIEMPTEPGTYKQTGNVYNYAIVGGEFFNIEPGEGYLQFSPSGGTKINFQPAVEGNIFYNYLYY